MAPLKDYKAIIKLIDRTFTRHEQGLVKLREDTIASMRADIAASHLTHLTHRPTAEESSGPVPTHRP